MHSSEVATVVCVPSFERPHPTRCGFSTLPHHRRLAMQHQLAALLEVEFLSFVVSSTQCDVTIALAQRRTGFTYRDLDSSPLVAMWATFPYNAVTISHRNRCKGRSTTIDSAWRRLPDKDDRAPRRERRWSRHQPERERSSDRDLVRLRLRPVDQVTMGQLFVDSRHASARPHRNGTNRGGADATP
jgi:hypothetical protein